MDLKCVPKYPPSGHKRKTFTGHRSFEKRHFLPPSNTVFGQYLDFYLDYKILISVSIKDVKRLLCLPYEQDLKPRCSFIVVNDDGNQTIRIPLTETRFLSFFPVQMLAKMLLQAKLDAGKRRKGVVLMVPSSLNNKRRTVIISSAAIAGLKVLCMVHETKAATISYGNFCRQLHAFPLPIILIS